MENLLAGLYNRAISRYHRPDLEGDVREADPQMDSSPAREPVGAALVRVRSPSLEAFLAEFSKWISDTEMFVPTETFPPSGSSVRLDLRVGNDWGLIQGKGRIAWVRREGEGPEKPAGIGVEFASLKEQSLKLLRWIVEDRKASQALGESQEAQASRKSEVEVVVPGATDSSVWGWEEFGDDRKRVSKPLLVAGLGVLTLALLAGGGLIWLERRAENPAVSRTATPPPVSPAPEASEQPLSELLPEDLPPKPAEPEEPEGESVAAGATEAIEAWAAAWRDQRAADYLASYAEGFEPQGDMSRAEWEVGRKEMIELAGFIELEIAELEIDEMDEWGAVATFLQTYRSDGYEDQVTKELRLILERQRWMILGERVVGQP